MITGGAAATPPGFVITHAPLIVPQTVKGIVAADAMLWLWYVPPPLLLLLHSNQPLTVVGRCSALALVRCKCARSLAPQLLPYSC
jgi:hypothetical protein